MTDVPKQPSATPNPPASISLQSRLPSLLPLVAIWVCALLPLLYYLIYQADPTSAVSLAITAKLWSLRALITAAGACMLGVLFYPPLPAWFRRFVDRTRTAWTTDRAPLVRALSELKHFETAQKHYEVARLAWIRSDYQLVQSHARRAVELDDSLPHCQHLLGQFLLRMKQLPEALTAFAAAQALDPGHAFGESQLFLAHVQHLLGSLEQANATFADYHRQHGGNHRSNYWHGEVLLALGQRDAAKAAFARAAADPKMRLTAEENWFRALARVRCWRMGSGGTP
jgi:tetratricopeptide (TPR) repeat protein